MVFSEIEAYKKVIEMRERLEKEFTEFEVRKVSRNRKTAEVPSLTLTKDLKALEVQPDEYILIGIREVDGQKEIVIRKIA